MGVQIFPHATKSVVARALNYAIKNGAKVSSNSYGGGSPSSTFANTIQNAPEHIFITAAGNSGSNNFEHPFYPCNYDVPNHMCVTSSNKDDKHAGKGIEKTNKMRPYDID